MSHSHPHRRASIVPLLSTILLLASGAARAQNPPGPADPLAPGPWKYSALFSLNFTQSSFTQNWSGGDHGSFSWVVNTDFGAERQFNTEFNLKNRLQLAYGQSAEQKEVGGTLEWDVPDKTSDLIAFESVGRFTLDRHLDPYASLRIDSQFNDTDSPYGTIMFNPVKVKESAGVARVFTKTEDSELISRIGFGLRQTFGQSFVPSTLEKVRFTSNDGGGEWQTNATLPLLEKKVIFKGELLVFLPVFYSSAEDLKTFDAQATAADPTHEAVADFWKTADVNFQGTFTTAITKFLSVNLFAQLVYDKFDTAANVDPTMTLPDQIAEIGKNVRKAGQFKETLALALNYKLF